MSDGELRYEPMTDHADLARFVASVKDGTRRMAIFVDETMYEPGKGYVPSAVFENEWGYYPLKGSGSFSQPWYWGHDLAAAKQIAGQANAEMGLSEDDVRDIRISSWAAAR
jgi:hypothetical protein